MGCTQPLWQPASFLECMKESQGCIEYVNDELLRGCQQGHGVCLCAMHSSHPDTNILAQLATVAHLITNG